MESYFASPDRKSIEEIRSQVELASANPVINTLLKNVGGLMAILNEDRQILVVNDKLFTLIGPDDTVGLLGLRLGEAVCCIHADEVPGGCECRVGKDVGSR